MNQLLVEAIPASERDRDLGETAAAVWPDGDAAEQATRVLHGTAAQVEAAAHTADRSAANLVARAAMQPRGPVNRLLDDQLDESTRAPHLSLIRRPGRLARRKLRLAVRRPAYPSHRRTRQARALGKPRRCSGHSL